jgi:dihydrodipicolinate synthase/N-acetylneuraminate lyase
LPLEVIRELAEHANIIGIKESSGNVEKVAAMVDSTRHIKRTVTVTEVQQAVTGRMIANPVARDANGSQLVTVGGLSGGATATQVTKPRFKTRTKEVGFQVLVGAAPTILASFQLGASGAVLALSAPAPTVCFEIYSAWKDNDLELAQTKQQNVVAASKLVVSTLGIPAVKHAMDVNGYYGGPPRLPLLPLSAAQKAEVESVMTSCRN